MTTDYLAVIARENYGAFQIILGQNLPLPYEDWVKLREEQCDQVARNGGCAQKVPVEAIGFQKWCGSLGRQPGVNDLDRYVNLNATGGSTSMAGQ